MYVQVADTWYIGYSVLKNTPAGAKVVGKDSPQEAVCADVDGCHKQMSL